MACKVNHIYCFNFLSSFMLSKLQLTPDTMKENGINELNKTTNLTITIISGIFGILFSSVIAFLIFLVISKYLNLMLKQVALFLLLYPIQSY